MVRWGCRSAPVADAASVRDFGISDGTGGPGDPSHDSRLLHNFQRLIRLNWSFQGLLGP